MKNFTKLTSIILVVLMLLGVYGCGNSETATDSPESTPKKAVEIKIATLSGPTGMGMAKMMSDKNPNYVFSVETDPQTLSGAMIQGSFDIAALPVNMAATLYNKTQGKVKIAAVNTLGNLYIIENGNTVNDITDLKGKTIVSAGQGATPEYVLKYLLEKNGIDPQKDVKIEFKSDHSEVSALLAADKVIIGLLPEPAATTILSKKQNLRTALDLNAIWDESAGEGNLLTQGCIVVNTAFADANKDALDAFLSDYEASVKYTNDNPDQAAKFIVENKIFGVENIAAKTIPTAKICYIDREQMKKAVENYLQVLFKANPKSVGEKVPDGAFYYNVK